jgi:hypothetical protein
MGLGRVRLKPDGTRWRTGGEVKGNLANGVGSQYSHATSERGVSSITNADAHSSVASSRLNWHPRRFKWTRPFRGETKSGFCACTITFQTQSTQRYAPAAISPQQRDPVPIAQEAGWAPVPVWTGAENLSPTGIRSPDLPARSQSLFRQRYPGHT